MGDVEVAKAGGATHKKWGYAKEKVQEEGEQENQEEIIRDITWFLANLVVG